MYKSDQISIFLANMFVFLARAHPKWYYISIGSCCSVTKSCSTLRNFMDCITPGFSVLHYVPEFEPSNHFILCRPLLCLPSMFPSIRVFSSKLALCIRQPKCWSFNFSMGPSNEYSGLISFRTDLFLPPCGPRNAQESSLAPQFEGINSSAFSLLYGPILTSLHDNGENNIFHYTRLLLAK